jgi:hypothetical protein
VQRSHGLEGFEHHQIEGALQDIGFAFRHVGPPVEPLTIE